MALTAWTFVSCDKDDNIIAVERLPLLSVEENIGLFGGKIIYEHERHGATYPWDWTEEFTQDIKAMWDICRRDVRGWNAQIGVFAVCEELCPEGEELLSATVEKEMLKKRLKEQGFKKFPAVTRIIRELRDEGLLRYDDFGDDCIYLSYKNEQIRKCLIKAGLVLELRVTLAGIEAYDELDDPVYNDVVNGAFIDWDGSTPNTPETYNTENEIDVLMMHGIVPVFVSCKNGAVGTDELYKLSAVAAKFGGKYAKKVLVATALSDADPHTKYLRQRAADMGIRLVRNLQDLSDEDLTETVATFWDIT